MPGAGVDASSGSFITIEIFCRSKIQSSGRIQVNGNKIILFIKCEPNVIYTKYQHGNANREMIKKIPTPFYVTFVIAVATSTAVMPTALSVTQMMSVAATRCRRIRICWKRQVINQWRLIK